jgi:hypothetical protein
LSAGAGGDRAGRQSITKILKKVQVMANSQDIKPNEKTYGGFIGLLKWSIPLIAVLVLIILVIIS